jgi:RNA polymerase sigma-70 factor, ECF subfamily
VERNSREAYEELFRREYAPLVAALATAHGDLDAAADAVQGAFVEAYDRWERIQFYDRPGAWVRRVAINRLIDDARRRTRRRRSRPRPGAGSYLDPDVDGVAIRAAVARLPTRQRLLVVARYFDDLSVREVAHLCGIAEGTVKSQLSAARHTLSTAPEVQIHD